MDRIGVLGGTGFYSLLDSADRVEVPTPFGAPPARPAVGRFGGRDVVFIPRHGARHQHAPHRLPTRATLLAMSRLGVRRVLSLTAVGSLRAELPPGSMVVPDQILDRTSGRVTTFADPPGTAGEPVDAAEPWNPPARTVDHVAFADPFCPALRAIAATRDGIAAPAATLAVINGPRFSTRAESRELRSAGADLVNMTAMPEAVLARELGLCYCALALVTDLDADADEGRGVTEAQVLAAFAESTPRLVDLLRSVIERLPDERAGCGCGEAATRTGRALSGG